MDTGTGGGGGPAPFLLKTYEMVDDTTTDAIVSWSATRKSFVVWNPPEFARVLLPSYFKHNNFSSFIRQLNTYGFRKIDPERWEFANEDFVKDGKHNLKNIHRRKPIHSHSQPQGSNSIDPERSAFEEEIDKLSREKNDLEGTLLGFEDQHSSAKAQLENLTHRIVSIEQRQEKLLTFLDKAVQNPEFVERLALKFESMDFSAYKKKRRLPEAENVSLENEKSDFCNISPQDFSDKLRLELSPTVSDINLVSHSTQSSNEDGVSPHVHSRTAGFIYPTETLDLSDTGTSFTLMMDSSSSCKVGPETTPKLHSIQQDLSSNDEGDGHMSCLLNLTLASPLTLEKSQNSIAGNDVPRQVTVQNRVNDVFWEQFLTEKPGCLDNEEGSSSFKAASYNEQEERRSGKEISKNTKDMEHLTL